jgi:hypothetical protein
VVRCDRLELRQQLRRVVFSRCRPPSTPAGCPAHPNRGVSSTRREWLSAEPIAHSDPAGQLAAFSLFAWQIDSVRTQRLVRALPHVLERRLADHAVLRPGADSMALTIHRSERPLGPIGQHAILDSQIISETIASCTPFLRRLQSLRDHANGMWARERGQIERCDHGILVSMRRLPWNGSLPGIIRRSD